MDRQGRPDIRVLVVDPDGTAAASTRDRLASAEGYEIDIAESRADALGRIDGVDCVLSEYDLDEGTGMDLLAAIRERAPHLPVILYTDATVEDVATRAIAAGVTDYIRKGEAREDVLRNRIEQAVTQARAERRAAAVERVNEVLREVNAALVRADTRSAIETAVCEILAGSDPYLFAWIGEYVPAEHRLLPRAHAGMEEGFLEQIPVGPESRLPDEGPGPEALETGEVQVTQNVADDPAFDDYAEAVRDRGYRSVAAVPIGHEGDLYGLLAIYASRPEAFGPEERDLLERLGVDIGHAIHTVAVQSELRRFRQAIDYAGHAVCITDPAGTIEYVNPTFEAQTGYTAAEAVGRSLSAIQPVGPADVRGDLGSVPRGETWVRELTATRKDGERYHAEQTIAPIVTDDGDLEGFVAIQADITESREQQEALRQETEMLEGLLETSPIGIVVLSPAGEIQRANERAQDILELSRSEITDRTYDEPEWQFVDESGDPLPESDHPFRRVLEEGEPVYDLEVRMARTHADPIWLSINGAPLFDPEGNVERVVFTFEDVTEMKDARRDLRETNETLETLIEAAPVGIVAWSPDTGITRWNEGAEEIFGWSAEEVRNMDRPPFVTGESADEFESLAQRALAGESFTGVEVTRETASGDQVDLHLSVAPIHDATGEITSIMAVLVDITEQKRREAELRQFREVVEHAGHCVMITDRDGTIEYVNPSFEAQTGYSAEEAIGQDPSILNSGEHDEAFFERLWETILDGEVWEHEIINERKDGTRLIVDQTIAPVFDEAGEIERFVAVNHDVTARREYERELERQNERLEEFASVVSHDLRNPLNVAEGHLDLLDADGPHASRIADALERMESIIDDVLTLAREGQAVEDAEALDLEAIARESWGVVDLPEDHLAVASLPPARGDEGRMRRVFENLYRNAAEHAGPDPRVRVGRLGETGFFVEDDGPGIEASHREDVFTSGFTTADEGTGLGLAIVRRLAEAQGWTVTLAESESGGARFEFRRTNDALS